MSLVALVRCLALVMHLLDAFAQATGQIAAARLPKRTTSTRAAASMSTRTNPAMCVPYTCYTRLLPTCSPIRTATKAMIPPRAMLTLSMAASAPQLPLWPVCVARG